ncbi:unnamed protein product [Rotaria magnacalcarata]
MRSIPEIIGLDEKGVVVNAGRNRTISGRVWFGTLIFLGVLSLALIITVIVQARNRAKYDNTNKNKNENDVCLTQGCISAATHQLRSIDSAVSSNLCKDFYTYACGGWQKTHPIQSFDVERTILGDIINRRDTEIERLLDSPIIRSDQRSWEYKVKTYYTECRDDYIRVNTSATYLIAIIQDPSTINGWFMFDNSAENVSQEALLKNQTLYQQMSHIHGDFGKFDEDDPTIKRLELYPAGLSMEVSDYEEDDPISTSRRAAFQIYIIEIMKLLAKDAGITDINVEDRAFTVANDVFTIEKFLADSLRRNPTSSVPRTTNLQEISTQFSFEFDQIMRHELDDPDAISILTPIYLTNNMYFTDAFELVTDLENPLFARMVHNYLRWRLVATYINDLPYNYVHKHREYLSAYYGYTLHSTNEDYCTREVIRRFPFAIQRLYTMNSAIYSNATTTVETVSNELIKSFKTYLDKNAKWMVDEQTKNMAKEKLNALTTAIGYASIASDDASLDDYYDKFFVANDAHLQNSYSYHLFHRSVLSNALKNPNLLDHWDFFETRPSRLFEYIAIFNRLFVVASGMHEPLVNAEWPWAMNFGSLGVLLAQKLFASIDGPDGRTHLPNGTRNDWWQPPTKIGYNNSRNCITDYYVNELKTLTYEVNGVVVQVQLAGEPFSPTTLRHIGALRIAHGALMRNNDMKSLKMPGTNLTSEQTFFLAYAQTQCYQRQPLLQLLRTQLGSYDEGTALNAALIHMPEFAKAFECEARKNQCFD